MCRLRDECERLIIGEVRNAEERAKAQIDLLIQCELSYMNTSHPDFIGFQAYVSLPCAPLSTRRHCLQGIGIISRSAAGSQEGGRRMSHWVIIGHAEHHCRRRLPTW